MLHIQLISSAKCEHSKTIVVLLFLLLAKELIRLSYVTCHHINFLRLHFTEDRYICL